MMFNTKHISILDNFILLRFNGLQVATARVYLVSMLSAREFEWGCNEGKKKGCIQANKKAAKTNKQKGCKEIRKRLHSCLPDFHSKDPSEHGFKNEKI